MHQLRNIGKTMVLIAALWAVGASLFIFFTPQTIEVVIADPGGSGVGQRFTEQQSWYQVQGLWGSFILVLFAAFYLFAYRSALKRNNITLIVMSVAGIMITFLTGFSIGGFYVPSTVGLFVGMLLITFARSAPRRADTP